MSASISYIMDQIIPHSPPKVHRLTECVWCRGRHMSPSDGLYRQLQSILTLHIFIDIVNRLSGSAQEGDMIHASPVWVSHTMEGGVLACWGQQCRVNRLLGYCHARRVTIPCHQIDVYARANLLKKAIENHGRCRNKRWSVVSVFFLTYTAENRQEGQ